MPLTTTGAEVQESMEETYGAKKGKQVFYASINKGKPGSKSWEKHKKGRRARQAAFEKAGKE